MEAINAIRVIENRRQFRTINDLALYLAYYRMEGAEHGRATV